MLRTQEIRMKPPGNGDVAVGFFGDDIADIGDRIASLSKSQALELLDYLKSLGVKTPPTALDLLFQKYPNGFPIIPGL